MFFQTDNDEGSFNVSMSLRLSLHVLKSPDEVQHVDGRI